MDNEWRFSLTVDTVVLMGLVGNTYSLLKDIGNMLRLLYYVVSAANCSEDGKPNSTFGAKLTWNVKAKSLERPS